jgi:hypothetical protein
MSIHRVRGSKVKEEGLTVVQEVYNTLEDDQEYEIRKSAIHRVEELLQKYAGPSDTVQVMVNALGSMPNFVFGSSAEGFTFGPENCAKLTPGKEIVILVKIFEPRDDDPNGIELEKVDVDMDDNSREETYEILYNIKCGCAAKAVKKDVDILLKSTVDGDMVHIAVLNPDEEPGQGVWNVKVHDYDKRRLTNQFRLHFRKNKIASACNEELKKMQLQRLKKATSRKALKRDASTSTGASH